MWWSHEMLTEEFTTLCKDIRICCAQTTGEKTVQVCRRELNIQRNEQTNVQTCEQREARDRGTRGDMFYSWQTYRLTARVTWRWKSVRR